MRKNYILLLSILQLLCFVNKNKLNAQVLTFQSNLNVTAITGARGQAGVTYTGTEYWVARWGSDSLFRISTTGTLLERFTIPGITGIRALAWDGTSIYAVLNTTTISKINPVTKTQVSTITAPLNVRHLSYVPTANAGAGGFWVGNFTTDLRLISLTGTTLQTIPAATHGLAGMYGSGYDTTSTGGGPWLWIYNQGTPNNCNLVRIPISTGIPDHTHNNFLDSSGTNNTSQLAGGAFLSTTINPGLRTLICLGQGTPNDFIYRYTIGSTLPIEFGNFSGEKAEEFNILKWTTISEQNNKGFEIQQSFNGQDFATIDFVNSKASNGNSSSITSYSYSHKYQQNDLAYYRLKQLDKDGKTSFSKIISIKARKLTKAEVTSIYPNPATTTANLTLEAIEDCKVLIELTDVTGKKLFVQNQNAKKGSNFFTLSLKTIQNGNYLVHVIVDGLTVSTNKLIKN